MRVLILFLALLLACVVIAPLEGATSKYHYIATAILVLKKPAPAPQPGPAPAPSGKCENCNGTGKLGDGTISVPCPVCGGDGIVSNSPAAAAVSQDHSPETTARPAAAYSRFRIRPAAKSSGSCSSRPARLQPRAVRTRIGSFPRRVFRWRG